MQLFTLMLNVFPDVMFQRFIPQYPCDCLFKSWFDAFPALPMSCCPLFSEAPLSPGLLTHFHPRLFAGIRGTFLATCRERLEEEGLGGVSKEQGGVPEGGVGP